MLSPSHNREPVDLLHRWYVIPFSVLKNLITHVKTFENIFSFDAEPIFKMIRLYKQNLLSFKQPHTYPALITTFHIPLLRFFFCCKCLGSYFTINCDLYQLLWNQHLAHLSNWCPFFGADCLCCAYESIGSWNDKLLQQEAGATRHHRERADGRYAVVKKWNSTNAGIVNFRHNCI